MNRIVATVILLLTTSGGYAYTALDLLRDCRTAIAFTEGRGQAGDFVSAAMCTGYINGMLDTNATVRMLNGDPAAIFCLPQQGIASEQAIRIVVKYLNDNPQHLNQSARVTAAMAVRVAFPCR